MALHRTLDGGMPPQRWAGRLRRELEAESTAASTSMEGVPVIAEEVRRILAGERPAAVSDAYARLVEGYRDAMSFVLRRADGPGFSWQSELILERRHRCDGVRNRAHPGATAAG